jgi:hypothetical protein
MRWVFHASVARVALLEGGAMVWIITVGRTTKPVCGLASVTRDRGSKDWATGKSLRGYDTFHFLALLFFPVRATAKVSFVVQALYETTCPVDYPALLLSLLLPANLPHADAAVFYALR